MSDTLKTIADEERQSLEKEIFARFLGHETDEVHNARHPELGWYSLSNWYPHESRDDLQLVIEKFTPEQLRDLADNVYAHAKEYGDKVARVIGLGVDAGIIYALKLPTATLADIAAQVIKETP